MGEQLKIFPEPEPTADEKLNAAQAEVRLAQMESARERDNRRSRRKRSVRARTESMKRMTKRSLELGRALFPPEEFADVQRPKTRAECREGQRPCPFVSCEHHLYLDVSAATGAIKLNFPDLEVDEMAESCALDVSERGGETLEGVGAIMNLTRERVRQIEVKALAKCQAQLETRAFRDLVDADPRRPSKRRLPVLSDDDEENDESDTCEGDDPRGDAEFDVESFIADDTD